MCVGVFPQSKTLMVNHLRSLHYWHAGPMVTSTSTHLSVEVPPEMPKSSSELLALLLSG